MQQKEYTVGIYGDGRISTRLLLILGDRNLFPNLKVVKIASYRFKKDIIRSLVDILQYDTVHGHSHHPITHTGNIIHMHNGDVELIDGTSPSECNWAGVDIVLDTTGHYGTLKGNGIKDGLIDHLQDNDVKLVLLTAPTKDSLIPEIVYGVNIATNENVVASSSCTTNVTSKIVSCLRGIIEPSEILSMPSETIHDGTNTNPTKDGVSEKSKGRAVFGNIIGTSTGASISLKKVIPEYAHLIDIDAERVLTMGGSKLKIVVQLKEPSVERYQDVKDAIISNAKSNNIEISNAYEYPVTRVIGNEHVAVIHEPSCTDPENVPPSGFKIVAFYDNEYGYSCQALRVAEEQMMNL